MDTRMRRELTELMAAAVVRRDPAALEELVGGLLAGDDDVLAFSRELVRSMVEAADLSQLSERELQIARLVGRALTNRQIANRIGKSPHTVNYHLRRIFSKLHIGSRVELAALVRRPDPVPARASRPAGPSPS